MKKLISLLSMIIFCAFCFNVNAQTTGFTYQGRLAEASVAANGTYQMQFTLFDALGGGTQQGSTITNNSVTVSNGVFTVQLDFTAAPFATGANRFIEIKVKKPADPGFTTLTPRQPITSTPYSQRSQSSATADNAQRSQSSATADNATLFGGSQPIAFIRFNDPRLSDARTPTAGSPNYIQNATPQAATFNISGSGGLDGTLTVGGGLQAAGQIEANGGLHVTGNFVATGGLGLGGGP